MEDHIAARNFDHDAHADLVANDSVDDELRLCRMDRCDLSSSSPSRTHHRKKKAEACFLVIVMLCGTLTALVAECFV